MDSELYVNSRKVLEWKYGYSTFEADITDFLENGNNEIMVGVHVIRNIWFLMEYMLVRKNKRMVIRY